MNGNSYLPRIAEITNIEQETGGERAIRTFRVKLKDDFQMEYKPGQTCMVSVFGKGESMFAISNSPTRKGFIEFSVMRLGRVTEMLHEMKVGDELGIRGPYGNGFPVDQWKGKNIYFIGGGVGMAPVRSVMNYIVDNKKDFGALHLIYGARSSRDLAYRTELDGLEQGGDIDVRRTIDVEEPGWVVLDNKAPENSKFDPGSRKFTGFVATTILALKCNPENALAVICGPPIMIKTAVGSLVKLGWKDEQIYTTLENRMKCGIGKCGRCNIGGVYVCVDGPVFTYAQVKKMLNDQ
ncbi:MAG TPA: FAD/NAD(P)-binding protein [Methanomassiliicoccales archaeon]|nr:FAD/NAD(P)-binding protein [Methanomassiliicoccales archaeon]